MTGPKILVRRHGALGDVLLTTPVIARLRAELFAVAPVIDVETVYRNVFDGNPDISGVYSHALNDKDYDRVIDLNTAYERRPGSHIVEAYFSVAFGDGEGSKRVIFGIDPPPPKELIRDSGAVTIHAAAAWPSRTFPLSFWASLAGAIKDLGLIPQFIGAGGDFHPEGFISLVRQTSLRESVNVIAASRCFICSDSSMLHFAGATDTPIVGLFTCTLPELRLPWRHGSYGWNCESVVADIECLGCLHEALPPVTYLTCKRGDNKCVNMVKVDDVISKVIKICQIAN